MKKKLPILFAIMRVSLFQFCLAWLCATVAWSSDVRGQELLNQKVSVEFTDWPVERALDQLRKHTGFKFLYNSYTFEPSTKLSVTAKDEPLHAVLDRVLKPLQVTYAVNGKQIILSRLPQRSSYVLPEPRPVLLALPDRVLTGQVRSADDNQPLPGVSILIKGTTQGTASDAEGRYRLSIPDQGTLLVFSYVGYESQEVAVSTQSTLDVVLQSDTKALSEVVVVGYGTVKKSDLTGAVSSISADELRKMPMTTLDQGLQGRAAGVQVTQTDAAPGGTVSIRIRGGTSINNSNEPLYVVDGFPVTAIKSLNPNDIESMEVLKDASATAIYGSRGANGVVIITTKQAKTGQSQFNVEYYTGIQHLIYKIPVLNTAQFVELANEAFSFRNLAKPFPNPEAVTTDTDWQDAIFRPAPISNYQVSFLKGNESTKFTITGNYFNQDGIITNSNFKRFSTRFNLESKINRRLTIGNNLQISYIRNNAVLVNSPGTGSQGVVHTALTAGPYIPIYDQDGNYFVDWQQIGPGLRRDNALSLARETTNTINTGRMLGNFYARYELLPGLSARVSLGTDLQYSKHNLYVPRTTYRGYFPNGIADINTSASINWLNENTLSYVKKVGRHDFNAVAGYTMQQETAESVQARGQGFVNDILGHNDLAAASVLQPAASGAYTWSLQSYLARLNYIFNNKYLFTVSVRADGSSRFGANNKWGVFPSGAVAWRLAEERFIQELGVFDDLKLRASYGITGYQEIPLYRSQASLSSTSTILGDNLAIGFAPNRIPNPDLKWERTGQFDIGTDMAFFKGRLRLTADYYHKKTNDLLFEVQIPWSTGFSTSYQNIGSTENRGYELALGGDIFTGEFKWTVDLNYSQNRNKVLDLGDVDEILGPPAGSSFYSPGSGIIIRRGHPVNSFFGYISDGLFRTQSDLDNAPRHRYMQLGDIRFRDVNQDGAITPDDRTIIGNAQPKFIYGFNNNFSYKNFDLNVFIQGVYGNDVLNLYRVYELESMRGTHNNHIRALDRWSPSNPDAYMPKADQRGQEQFISTRAIEDGSFLRLRNVVLGYNLPSEKLNLPWLRSLRVYLSGQNLFTLTSYTGYDPEVNTHGQNSINQGIDYGAYPRAKTFMVGVNLGL
ncbi:TonB-dependent receptor [Rhabdobacter roseus]|uniref:TonB-linked SusC/RagA family outer membrane protein n=1 Tax=Rhabdobacter roseus TaxID=1655419 RepID=A0A840TUW3_9BACT|nr:TonB-dependent receptor [Rhabdobacter roseus]MBB5283760.1 TonB-linked SusC/RagA family outer membrane protein [Rhabdobacter roseus]